MTYSHMGPPTLPSAQLHFTSEFGMGSGGSTTLLSLGETFIYLLLEQVNAIRKASIYLNSAY